MNTRSLQFAFENLGKTIKRWKHYLPIINLALFIGVIGLAIMCVLFVYYPPENTIKSEKRGEETPIKKKASPSLAITPKTIDHYDLILTNNPFSPNRTSWTPPEAKTDPTKPGGDPTKHHHEEEIAQPVVNQQKPRGTPKKITLRGILILGGTRKALIENPDQTKSKKPFIFIEEGEEVAEYKVKNIETDQIRLDWYGEEQVIVMRSNIKK